MMLTVFPIVKSFGETHSFTSLSDTSITAEGKLAGGGGAGGMGWEGMEGKWGGGKEGSRGGEEEESRVCNKI